MQDACVLQEGSRHIGWTQSGIGARFAGKGKGAFAGIGQGHKSERRKGLVVARNTAGIHTDVGQGVDQKGPMHIVAHPADERAFAAQPADGCGHIGRRAAWVLLKQPHAGLLVDPAIGEVDQHLAQCRDIDTHSVRSCAASMAGSV